MALGLGPGRRGALELRLSQGISMGWNVGRRRADEESGLEVNLRLV